MGPCTSPGWPEIRPLTVVCMWYTAAAKVPVRQEDVPVFLQDCVTDLCRCCNCANTKETEELEDNSPDTDSEDWVSLICYFLFSFVQFYISYFIFFIKIVFMLHQCCFNLWKNEWMNERTNGHWYKYNYCLLLIQGRRFICHIHRNTNVKHVVIVCGQDTECLRKEAPPQSLCSGLVAAETWPQCFEKSMVRMLGVLYNTLGPGT